MLFLFLLHLLFFIYSIFYKDLSKDISSVKIFPNPANEVINLSFELKQSDDMQIKILDLAGRECYQQYLGQISGHQAHQIDISALKKGSYVLILDGQRNHLVKSVNVN